MSIHNIGLHLKHESQADGRTNLFRISEFSFNNEPWRNAHGKIAPLGKIYLLRCKCGANDWSDNGRTINEYECNCCGQFVLATEHGS